MTIIKWCSSAQTDTGNVRQLNEDAQLQLPEARLWLVADGMGGHDAGDLASQLIVHSFKTFNQRKKARSLNQMVKEVVKRLKRANRLMLKEAAERSRESIIGSTVVVLVAWGSRCAAVWAGDSRIYRYRRKKLIQITKDHSEVQKLVDLGVLAAEHAQFHPASNAITNALGVFKDFKPEIIYDTFKPGDRYLLCSDGLTNEVNDYEIAQCFGKYKRGAVVKPLMDMTLSRPARDNVTMAVVWRKNK